MLWFWGGGVLRDDHWVGHCHWYYTCALFCYRHHCHFFLLTLFWIVPPWPFGVSLWFGSCHLIYLVARWLMAIGSHRLGLLGILDFPGGPCVSWVLQLSVLSGYGILRQFLYCHGLFQIAPWLDWQSQFLLGCRCASGYIFYLRTILLNYESPS